MRSRPTAAVATAAMVAALVLPTAAASAAPPAADGLVISEYVEGSSFQKAIEVYNGTGTSVSLSGLEYRLYSNGRPLEDGPTSRYAFPVGDLAPGEVFVVTHPSFNDDEGLVVGGDIDATSSAINFNGDDAFTLVDTTSGAVVDSFKQVGARINNAADATLRRTNVTRDTDPTDAEDLDAQYDPAARGDSNDVSHLGIAPGADTGDGSDDEEPTPTCDMPDEELTLISEIQGADADPDARSDSPLHGEEHTVRAVVTLADTDLDGYFVQEEEADVDGDPATSEGLFVRQTAGDLPREGQTVELTGAVTAFFGRTQLSSPATEVCDVAPTTIEPIGLELPLDRDGREALESMLVSTTQDLQVSGLFSAYAYGELGLAVDGPLLQPTSVFAPDDPAAADLLASNAASYLKVNDRDEAYSSYNPFPWERFDDGLSAGDTMAAGDVVGALNYSFGEFKVEPLDEDVDGNRIFFPETADTDQRQPAPALAGGNDVVSFNVLNYFNDFGDSAVLRGARDADQFALQTAKIVDAIVSTDAAVYGLVELENDYEDHYDGDPETVPAIQDLVDALNDATAPGTYDWVVPDQDVLTTEGLGGGGLGTDAIAQGLVYQPGRAEPVGPATTFDIDSELTGDADNNRWPLAQTFRIDGQWVTVVVNHLKSKGSPCTDTAGPGFGFGDDVETALTGNCDLTRTHAAERLVEWVQGGATPFPTTDVLLVGDFNAYEEERPIEVFVEAGFTDLVETLGDDAFTYKFDGRYGRLDHAFSSPSLTPKVVDAAVWQANSREPVGFLYHNHPVDDSAYASSDHDPVVVSLAADDGDRRPGAAGRGGRR